MERLGREVEKAKIAISTLQDTPIWLDELCSRINFRQILTRAQFEDMTESLRHGMMATITDVLRDNGIGIDDVLLFGGSAHIPSIKAISEAAFRGRIRVNSAMQPDEVVVHGAAIQAHVLSTQSSVCTLGAYDDSTRLSLGVETIGGIMTQIVPRVSVTPTYKARKLEVVGRDHDSVTINFFEGERPNTKDNILLASFDLKHSPATTEGRPQIEIRFAGDAGGLVEVCALDLRSGRSNCTLITSAHARIFDEEIEERLFIATLNVDADNKSKAKVEASVADIGEKKGQSALIYIPEDRTNDNDRNISNEPQWKLKTWLSYIISRANKASKGYLNWHGDGEEILREEGEQDEL